jgi:hypothetical protein
MNDPFLQLLGDGGPSMDAVQFSQRVGDLGLMAPPAQAQGASGLSRQRSLGAGGRSSGRTARAAASNASGDTSNSGKPMQEIWQDIMSAPAGPGFKRQPSATQGQAAFGTLASGLSGINALLQDGGATLGSGAFFRTNSIISQASLDKLISDHPGKTTNAKEWMGLLGAAYNPPPMPMLARSIAGSQKVALENAALEVMAAPPRRTKSKEKAPAPTRKATPAAAKKAPAAKEPTKKRGRAAIEETDRPVINLPPKKKGRRRKGEVDTETEEEKALRAEERQRKNRESAARSHRRKAQFAEELEKKASAQDKKIADLEKENAKLKRQLSEAKEKLKKHGLGSPQGSLKRTASAKS